MTRQADFLIIGGGIAGASAAHGLSPYGRVIVLEAEDQLAYHTTGRSAAFYSEVYGGPKIQPLTAASRAFLTREGTEFLSPRGCLYVAWDGDEDKIDAMLADFAGSSARVRQLDAAAVLDLAPALKADNLIGGVYDPDCSDMDVHAIHQAFLKTLRTHKGEVVTGARVRNIHYQAGLWQVETPKGRFAAPILVNAAGAWGDDVARLAGVSAVGLTPKRRTIATFTPIEQPVDNTWPLTIDISERFYFKPESGRILASLADETPSPPCDAQPEELDIAVLIDRLEQATHWRIPRIHSKWAGLRTFAPDRLPVFGFDPEAEGFFWCVGQGGWGIQTAPAAADLVTHMATGEGMSSALRLAGVIVDNYTIGRLR